MAKTDPVNTAVPAGTENPRQGDDRIRALARGVVELVDVDHYMGTPTGSAYDSDDAGKHSKVTFAEVQGSKPTIGTDKGVLYPRGATPELYYEDSAGNEVKVTDGGYLNGAALKADSVGADAIQFENNKYLTQKDSSGTARNVAGINASNQTVLGGTGAHDVRLSDATVSGDDDRHVADKGYVDDSIDAISYDDKFGAWATKSNDTTYTAETDGFVLAYITSHGYIDAYTPASTLRMRAGATEGGLDRAGLTMPVRKGDTWKVTGATAIFWLPIGG
jgi:hypothetical protein